MSSFSRAPLTPIAESSLAAMVHGMPSNGVRRLVEGVRRQGRTGRHFSVVDGNLQSHRYIKLGDFDLGLFSSAAPPFETSIEASEIADALAEYRSSGIGRVALPAAAV